MSGVAKNSKPISQSSFKSLNEKAGIWDAEQRLKSQTEMREYYADDNENKKNNE